MHLFLINFPPKIEGHDSFCQFSHMYSCLDLGRTHNLLRTCFLSSCHRGHQPPNQVSLRCLFLPTSRAKARESS